MREIKFRVWNTALKKMYQPRLKDICGCGYGVKLDESGCFWSESNENDLIWMQFTGLLDKNGKEVWEGDIVSVDRQDSCPSFNQATIIYAENHGSFLLKYTKKVNPKGMLSQETIHSKDKKTIFGTCTGWDIEIIGNIYENPELIEEEVKGE